MTGIRADRRQLLRLTAALASVALARLGHTEAPPVRLAGLYFPDEISTERQALLDEFAVARREAVGQPDRWGEVPVLAFDAAGQSLQLLLLQRGLALVETRPGEPLDPRPLYAAEDEARANRRGVWRQASRWRINAATLAGDSSAYLHRFVIVYGRLQEVSVGNYRTYLNFSADYRKDTTAIIDQAWRAYWEDAPFDLEALAGQVIEVRAPLQRYNGPSLALTHWQTLRRLP